MNCDDCVFYEYDEDEDAYFCSVDMDEDDYGRLMSDARPACRYYQRDDEYAVVRHQM